MSSQGSSKRGYSTVDITKWQELVSLPSGPLEPITTVGTTTTVSAPNRKSEIIVSDSDDSENSLPKSSVNRSSPRSLRSQKRRCVGTNFSGCPRPHSHGGKVQKTAERPHTRTILTPTFTSACRSVSSGSSTASATDVTECADKSTSSGVTSRSSCSVRRDYKMIRKENFALPTVLREYYTYLGHDIDAHQRGGKVRKTNKYPYKLLCTICDCVVRGHDGSRRGVYNHLKQEHGIHIHTVSTDDTEVGAVRQVAVEKTFSRRHAIQRRFDTSFFRYVVTSGTPFKMLTNHHLHDSLRSLQPGVRPMSVKYFRKQLRIINNMKVVPYIRWLIQNVKDVTVLLDCWSTRRLDSVLAIQVAYLNADFKMIKKTVSVLRLLGRHTAQNIRTVVLKEFGKYNLGPKVRFVVTDAGSNMRKAFGGDFAAEGSLVNYVQGFCLAHKLHRVVTNAIKSIPLVESHLARMVSQITYIRRSPLLNDQFQVLAGGVTLKRPVVTRWNSYFDALKQFTTESVFNAVVEVIGVTHLECNYIRAPAPHRFDPSELNELRDILRALESLAAVTDDLQSDALVATEAIPKITGVYEILDNMTMTGPVNEFVSSLKTQLVQSFENIFKTEALLFMTLLNPAFRHLFFDAYLRRLPFNPFNLPSSDDVLEMFVRKYPTVDEIFTVEQPSTPTAGVTGRKITAMWEERITDIENERHFTSHNEITQYLTDAANIHHTETERRNPHFLSYFWKNNMHRYPNLYDAARVVFTCVISTASVERCFSILGQWLAPRRNRLHIATLGMLLQVRENISLLEEEPSDTTVRAWQQFMRSEFASTCGADEAHSSEVCSTSSDSDSDSCNENCENQCIQQSFSVVQDCVSEELGEDSGDEGLLTGDIAFGRVIM